MKIVKTTPLISVSKESKKNIQNKDESLIVTCTLDNKAVAKYYCKNNDNRVLLIISIPDINNKLKIIDPDEVATILKYKHMYIIMLMDYIGSKLHPVIVEYNNEVFDILYFFRNNVVLPKIIADNKICGHKKPDTDLIVSIGILEEAINKVCKDSKKQLEIEYSSVDKPNTNYVCVDVYTDEVENYNIECISFDHHNSDCNLENTVEALCLLGFNVDNRLIELCDNYNLYRNTVMYLRYGLNYIQYLDYVNIKHFISNNMLYRNLTDEEISKYGLEEKFKLHEIMFNKTKKFVEKHRVDRALFLFQTGHNMMIISTLIFAFGIRVFFRLKHIEGSKYKLWLFLNTEDRSLVNDIDMYITLIKNEIETYIKLHPVYLNGDIYKNNGGLIIGSSKAKKNYINFSTRKEAKAFFTFLKKFIMNLNLHCDKR